MTNHRGGRWSIFAGWLVFMIAMSVYAQIGTLSGLAGLTSPVLTVAWAGLTVWRIPVRQMILSGAIAAMMVSPWVIRNSVVFGKWIPTKSNAGFELYQSLYDEPAGVVTRRSMRLHPYVRSSQHGRRYREIGEIAFVAEKSILFRERLAAEPIVYLDQVCARLEAATLQLPNWLTTVKISHWHRLVSWFYPLIFIGFLSSFLMPDHRWKGWVTCSQIAYVMYLMPYILVSFYERYAVALWLPQTIFIVCLMTQFKRLGKYLEKKCRATVQ